MSRRQPKPFTVVTDEILAEAQAAAHVKQAEVDAVRAATPRFTTEIGQLMHKVADDLRAGAPEVTYDDLNKYLAGELR